MERLVLSELIMSDDSDDSFGDEEYMYRKRRLLLSMCTLVGKGSRICIKNFLEIADEMSESDFISHFRLKCAIVNDLIKTYEEHNNSEGHQSASYRDVANRFDMSLSNLYYIILNEVVEFICKMAPAVICWPNVEQQNTTVEFFKNKTGFPGVIGSLDGSVHDARVFRNSHVIDNMRTLPNRRWVLRDSAYPCLKPLLTLYRDYGYLTYAQTKYNKVLSSTRIYIEHLRNISLNVKIIKACCVLYNMEKEDLQFMEVLQEVDFNDMADVFNENFSEGGQDIRQEVTAIINAL
ncbi:hypothetical protein NQ314_002225 [Rhamnusium bicolor]|uniref:DDE Tnp4 domain-containing protein n=1 Tax=Rhamnusium bicolor TaxID=1586634 RepID=A0AAV8ZPW9_9CUCU|nr:hypothetical protein NQ314_002225 [Rhamnusium bicolor]